MTHYRAITAEDAKRAAMLAIRPANVNELTVVRLAWEVDGMNVDSPIGEFGSRLTATVELVPGNGNVVRKGVLPDGE